jgi:hypothetical protein
MLPCLVPQFDLSISMPFIKATMSDTAYQLMTSVAAENVAELPELPAGAQWLTGHYQSLLPLPQEAAEVGEERQASWPAVQAGAPAVAPRDNSPTQVRVFVSIGHAELELLRHVGGIAAASPLARAALEDVDVVFRRTDQVLCCAVLCCNVLCAVLCCAVQLSSCLWIQSRASKCTRRR